jgi:hypothetical protein
MRSVIERHDLDDHEFGHPSHDTDQWGRDAESGDAEDELTQEICSEILTHEAKIEALCKEMATLKNRRLRSESAREAWTKLSANLEASHNVDNGVESESQGFREDAESHTSPIGSETVREKRNMLTEDELLSIIDTLRGDVEKAHAFLRDKDRQRQIEVEQQVQRWRREADESVGVAEQLRALVVERDKQVRLLLHIEEQQQFDS